MAQVVANTKSSVQFPALQEKKAKNENSNM
jgi:hypothetical protein